MPGDHGGMASYVLHCCGASVGGGLCPVIMVEWRVTFCIVVVRLLEEDCARRSCGRIAS